MHIHSVIKIYIVPFQNCVSKRLVGMANLLLLVLYIQNCNNCAFVHLPAPISFIHLFISAKCLFLCCPSNVLNAFLFYFHSSLCSHQSFFMNNLCLPTCWLWFNSYFSSSISASATHLVSFTWSLSITDCTAVHLASSLYSFFCLPFLYFWHPRS